VGQQCGRPGRPGETILFENGATRHHKPLSCSIARCNSIRITAGAVLHRDRAAQCRDLENARGALASLRDLSPPASVMDALDKQIAHRCGDRQAPPDPATAIHRRWFSRVPGRARCRRRLAVRVVRSPQGGPPLASSGLTATFPQQVELCHGFGARRPWHERRPARQADRANFRRRHATASPGDLTANSRRSSRAGATQMLVDKRSHKCGRALAPIRCARAGRGSTGYCPCSSPGTRLRGGWDRIGVVLDPARNS